MKWDTTPAPGTTVDDLGHGVTVVLRDPPRTTGTAWIAPFALNCAAHGWQVSRRTAGECAAEGREHLTRRHAPAETCTAETPCPVRAAHGGLACAH